MTSSPSRDAPQLAQSSRSRRQMLLIDIAVAAGLLAFNVLFIGGLVYTSVGTFWLSLGISVGMFGPYAFRRVWPVTAAAVVVVAALVQLVTLEVVPPAFHIVGVPLAVYWLAAYGPRWTSLAGLGTAVTGGVMFGIAVAVSNYAYTAPPLFQVVISVSLVSGVCILIVAATWALGDLNRRRRQSAQALAQYAAYLETEAKNARALAAADERAHIAREMHDIVAHSLSVIITQADGARYAGATQPQVAVDTLGTIAQTGRTALSDMRTLLGVLRTDDQLEHRPQPKLQDLPDLLETMELSGLNISYKPLGLPPPKEKKGFSPMVEVTIYRVIQEALTNALKHSGVGTEVELVLDWGDNALRVSVADQGNGAPETVFNAHGAGQGLVGIEERLAMIGGTFTAGPLPGSGFKVSAVFPYPQR